ncbi:MAG: hypothetical protein Fur0024_2250 [Patescibacteria group bacterium]
MRETLIREISENDIFEICEIQKTIEKTDKIRILAFLVKNFDPEKARINDEIEKSEFVKISKNSLKEFLKTSNLSRVTKEVLEKLV